MPKRVSRVPGPMLQERENSRREPTESNLLWQDTGDNFVYGDYVGGSSEIWAWAALSWQTHYPTKFPMWVWSS